METALFELARSDSRYAYEAYEFVCEAVTYTQQRLGKHDDETGSRHVRGEDLLRGGCELAVREFGLMAPLVFRRWGVVSTDDFGEIVFRLINAGRLSCDDEDDPEDFHDRFDLLAALADGYALSTAAYAANPVER